VSDDGLIRDANDHDGPAIVDLWTDAYFREGEGGRVTPYSEADFIETARHGRVLVAERQGTVVGVVALFAPGTPERAVAQAGEAELARLVVAASGRRLGTGRALVERCEQLARAAGWDAIALWSRRYQAEAHRLYESLGYERLPERDSVDGTGFEHLVFRLDLGRSSRTASNSRPTRPES
jgi:ribosomal protein S18 acetylase RimI-like enzyme